MHFIGINKPPSIHLYCPDFSVIVPTLNEAPNIPVLLRRVFRALEGHAFEVVVVDDASTDHTAEITEREGARLPGIVRVFRRAGTRGLSASILDGFRAARGRVLGVIDADLQHDPRVLPELLRATETSDIAIGSRYAFRGKICGWSAVREAQSRAAALLTRAMLGLRVQDPLSGFFCLRRGAFEAVAPYLEARGWKLLLEILALSPGAHVAEVPFTFGPRHRGQTKMSSKVVSAWLSDLRRLRRVQRARVAAAAMQEAIA